MCIYGLSRPDIYWHLLAFWLVSNCRLSYVSGCYHLKNAETLVHSHNVWNFGTQAFSLWTPGQHTDGWHEELWGMSFFLEPSHIDRPCLHVVRQGNLSIVAKVNDSTTTNPDQPRHHRHEKFRPKELAIGVATPWVQPRDGKLWPHGLQWI